MTERQENEKKIVIEKIDSVLLIISGFVISAMSVCGISLIKCISHWSSNMQTARNLSLAGLVLYAASFLTAIVAFAVMIIRSDTIITAFNRRPALWMTLVMLITVIAASPLVSSALRTYRLMSSALTWEGVQELYAIGTLNATAGTFLMISGGAAVLTIILGIASAVHR